MSETRREARGARRETGGGRFDEAIDLAVREMLDVEPPAGLRGRVLDRIESPRRGFAWLWIAGPLAAAAMIVLAVLLPAKTERPVVNPATTVATKHTPAAPEPVTNPTPPAVPQVPPQTTIAKATARQVRTQQSTGAVVAAADASADVAWLEPLPGPEAIDVVALEPSKEASLRAIDLAPAQIPALEVRPITDTPRERRNQE
jgi:hypothetical protein